MNGGDSDTDALIYRWQNDRFIEDGALKLSGGEDAEFFALGEEFYLVTAGVRSAMDPIATIQIRCSTGGSATPGHPSKRLQPSLRSSGISFVSVIEPSWPWRKD